MHTRPPSYFDVTRRVVAQQNEIGYPADTFTIILEMVNAIRGTEYTEPSAKIADDRTVQLRNSCTSLVSQHDPLYILGNLTVKDHWCRSVLTGNSVRTVDRLRGFAEVVSSARARAIRHPGQSLLLLPELSLPRRWFREVEYFVRSRNEFGFLAGLEYNHRNGSIYNEAWAVLPQGLHQATSLLWVKGRPARQEELDLREHGLAFPAIPPHLRAGRMVVESPYGRFSVLICSELMETRQVADLLGRVETVLVPSWNKDTASYDHLIQSVGLQLHAIVAIANNGHFSDSRVWAPRDIRWQRDLCRLIERDVDDVLSVVIQLRSLREFRRLDGERSEVPSREVVQREWRLLPPDWSCDV